MAKYDPQATRETLLQAAFEEVYHQGLKAASLDSIVGRAGVTKGALYHHFDTKKSLCQAALREVILPRVMKLWVTPLRGSDDPIPVLQGILRNEAENPPEEMVRYGCPLNNLSQEVASTDEELRDELDSIYQIWIGAVRDALARGQGAGTVRRDAEPSRVARFMVASIEGSAGMAKSARCPRVLRDNYRELELYLGSLRPAS